MKILITGGYGFIGSHGAERFAKEGHTVYIIDNLSTGSKNNINCKHTFYNLNVIDKNCEQVFRNHNIDMVVHLAAQVDVNISNNDARLDCESNILGLVNILDLSQKYKVKKFIFASSAAVYGDAQHLPISELAPIQPISNYGLNKAIGEWYCRQWKERYGLETIILRFANVYGPRQGSKGEAGVISVFLKKIMEEKELAIYGDGQQTRDYVYVEDVVDAIYKTLDSSIQSQVLNISTNTEQSLKDLLQILEIGGTSQPVHYAAKRNGDIYRSKISNGKAVTELGWTPKYSLRDGLARTYSWYQTEWSQRSTAASVTIKKRTFNKTKPYLENLLLFIIMSLLSYANVYSGFMDFRLGLDYNYVYIAIMGFLYGKNQSLLATAFSTLIFIAYMMARGADFVTLVYQTQYLAHIAAYLCVGVVTGYVTDNVARMNTDKDIELSSLKERYTSLQKMYIECSEVKDNLYAQVVNSDDSIGKIYSIVREMDSLSTEQIYTAAIAVVGKIMKIGAVDLYTVNRGETYWRLKVKSDAPGHDSPNSINIKDHEYAKIVMASKDVFVNRDLIKDCPVMVAPILHEGKVIAVIQIYNLDFEQLTLYYVNLFRITAMLIADSLTKAYLYDQGLQTFRYVEGTEILITEEFEKIEADIQKRKEFYPYEIAELKIMEETTDYETTYIKLAGSVRAEDYVGVKQDGYLYILLLNITAAMVMAVRERLEKKGILTMEVLR